MSFYAVSFELVPVIAAHWARSSSALQPRTLYSNLYRETMGRALLRSERWTRRDTTPADQEAAHHSAACATSGNIARSPWGDASQTPRSVMSPLTSRAGVTSKAGLAAGVASGDILTCATLPSAR